MPIIPPEEGNGRVINSGLHASTKVLKEAVWSDELRRNWKGKAVNTYRNGRRSLFTCRWLRSAATLRYEREGGSSSPKKRSARPTRDRPVATHDQCLMREVRKFSDSVWSRRWLRTYGAVASAYTRSMASRCSIIARKSCRSSRERSLTRVALCICSLYRRMMGESHTHSRCHKRGLCWAHRMRAAFV